MMANRIIAVLVGLTVIMQGLILYRQYHPPQASRPPQPSIRPAPRGTSFDLTNVPVDGDARAKVALIEFSDYECPYCARHATDVGPELHKEFVATGKVRYGFVNNPLPIHANAKFLASVAICAGEQNRYWQMHDILFEAKPRVQEQVVLLAKEMGLDSDKFRHCIADNPRGLERIETDMRKAKEFGLTGTPSFAIGRLDDKGRVSILTFITGAQPLSVFEKAINEALSRV